jgi:hypothetical protein
MGPKLRARLANIVGMSAEELQQLIVDLTAAFDLLDDNNGSTDDLGEIAEAIDTVRAEEASRVERQGIRDRVHLAETPSEPGDVDEDADADADESDEDADEDDADEDADDEAEADAETPAPVANRPSLGDVQAASTRSKPNIPSNLRVATRLVVGGDVSGFSAGAELDDKQLGTAMVRKLQALGRGGTPDKVLVATLVKEYPEERILGDDPFLNDEKMAAVMAESLTAAGGICQPLAVDYSITTIGSTERPLQAGLPSYNATRGGVKFTVPPTLADAPGPLETWTLQDDEDALAGTPVKACFRIDCQDPEEAVVYAIPVCLTVGNMMGRFTPEIVSAQTALLDVAAARMAELELLNAIDATSIATTSTGVLGTLRTILPTLDLLNAAYRYRYRLGSSTARWVLPAWVKEEVRADLAMELAHDNPPFGVSDAQINGYFATRNVSPIWMLEDKAGSFGAAQAPGVIHPWPASFVAYYFAEGTYQFLDGGRIDLGVVRDSVLNSTNDYQIWREDFEGIAKRGNESIKCTITTKPTGMSAGTKDTSV